MQIYYVYKYYSERKKLLDISRFDIRLYESYLIHYHDMEIDKRMRLYICPKT